MNANTVVLVHGAWHGGWCWDRVRPLLEASGLRVLTPTLPGLEKGASDGPAPGLEEHIAAITSEVERAEGAVLLVGHSYGGMVVTGAAARVAGRLTRLVYLDAAVPSDGQSFASHIPGIEPEAVARREAVFKHMAGGTDWIPAPAFEMIGISTQEDRDWLAPLLTPHPLRTWLEPVAVPADTLSNIPRTYVLATDPPTTLMGYPAHGERAKTTAGWTYREVATGHEMIVTAPERTAELIIEAARA